MTRRRLLVLGLDGFEASIADGMMADGKLPHLAALKARSARFDLDHGRARLTGLGWEHFSTGLSPDRSGRQSAVDFDPGTYEVSQRSTQLAPCLSGITSKVVVFDPPYFDLRNAPEVQGVVNWGAHDAGVASMARPDSLEDEMHAKFGPYPATDSIYAFTWPSVTRTRAAAESLVEAVDRRAAISRWLLCERLPDWDLGLVVVSESHSVIEPMWHGIDATHPLAGCGSAAASRDGIERVYKAIDRLIGTLVAALPDVAVIAFSMHGMGTNTADVASMLLLPELLYRLEFRRTLFEPRPEWLDASGDVPTLSEWESWEQAVRSCMTQPTGDGNRKRLLARVANWFASRRGSPAVADSADDGSLPLDWMPAARYRTHWPAMRAFALPAFYDGRIRLNLVGRESRGRVEIAEYGAVCDEIERNLHDCRDRRTGDPIVESVRRTRPSDPMGVPRSDGDLAIVWRGACDAIVHDDLGEIGPAPWRRTGGHTGGHGFLYAAGCSLPVGNRGVRSSFDVAPTVLEALGEPARGDLSGHSVYGEA